MDPTKKTIDRVRYALYLPIHGSISGFNSKIRNDTGWIMNFGFEVHNEMTKA